MRFTASSVLALMAMAAPVLGQVADFDSVTVPAPDQMLASGAVLNIQWSALPKYQSLFVNLILIGGSTQNTQQRLGTIASGVPNSAGSFSWPVTPMGDIQNFYGIIIESASDPTIFQYSNPFHISSASASASSSSSATAPSSSTTTVVLSSMTAAPSSAVSSAAASSAAQSETLIVVDVTTTVPCETSAPTAAATSVAVVVPVSSAAPAAESSPAGPVAEPSTVTPAAAGPTAASTGVSGPSTFTSAVWTSPASPPAPTGGIPTTSGATRVAGSMAVIGGLIAAFLAL